MENYTSDSSDSDNNGKVLDFSFLMLDPETVDHNLEAFTEDDKKPTLEIETIILRNNQLTAFPESIVKFSNLKTLDISSNGLNVLPDVFEHCPLTTIIAKNNNLTNESLPKTFTISSTLREFNLSGNLLTTFPEQLLDFASLKYLYLGGNRISSISRNVWRLSK